MRVFLLFFALLFLGDCWGQNPSDIKRTYHWYFGWGAGIDFSSGNATVDTTSSVNFGEACATISDTSGNLLFYTDGDSVWNAAHQIMPNGRGLMGCGTTTQGALIVPKPDDSNIYYVFTLDWGCGDTIGKLRYSIINMTLDGGLGDVSIKNVLLFSPATEQLSAVHHCNKKDIWITTHELNTNNFYTYLITDMGIDTTPIISSIGSIYPNCFPCVSYDNPGQLKFSPNGKKLAVASNIYIFPSNQYSMFAELFDFDNQTGVISNFISLPVDSIVYYGVSFSPDNSKLYFTGRYNGFSFNHLIQYDLTDSTSSVIVNSKTEILNSLSAMGGLQLASDNKIYVTKALENSLGVIQNPNALGVNCNYLDNGLNLNNRTSLYTLPNFIESFFSISNDSCGINGLSIKSDKVEKINIYPNPFNQFTTIEFENLKAEEFIFILYDFRGQECLKINSCASKIILERKNLLSGGYFYQLTNNRKIIASGKLIVYN